jgi:hypothetical protein
VPACSRRAARRLAAVPPQSRRLATRAEASAPPSPPRATVGGLDALAAARRLATTRRGRPPLNPPANLAEPATHLHRLSSAIKEPPSSPASSTTPPAGPSPLS